VTPPNPPSEPDTPGDSYQPSSFWEERLGSHLDLSGTGEPGLSVDYNRACYRLRERVLDRELLRAGVDLTGARVLDVGSGVGFFVDFYLRRGARVTGVELTRVGAEYLERRFPGVPFIQGDVVEVEVGEGYDVVNAFDVLYHIVEDERWEAALTRLARGLAPGGTLALTDVVAPVQRELAAHNVMRDRDRYAGVLGREGVRILSESPTHYLLNRELGPWRKLNRFPSLLYAIDSFLMRLAAPSPEPANRLLVARRDS
jgi:2-polyprenyl-3-methyl-5-hydroxy-6-metoxy-1,4-benzoquinol methylase